jgi:pimeloyl-ACP methyl ester carboxylesterase
MRIKPKRIIYLDEYVSINGIDQFLFHLGTKRDNPVMLFLHGGPGSSESLFTEAFQHKWEENYTVVHWDQRGAGKTLSKNPDQQPTIELMLQDLLEVIHYLKKKYQKNKIILLGHSWGSVLGSVFIKRHPEEVAYYIGVGQVVCMVENEQIGYDKVKEEIGQADDQKSMKKLESIGEYPGEAIVFDKVFLEKCKVVRKLQRKYRLDNASSFNSVKTILKSPIFKFSDILAFLNIAKANKQVHRYLGEFNLRLESPNYQIPIYYILGGNDWEVPYIIAQDYFNLIIAPRKMITIIPDAGHLTMMDQPDLFYEALSEIHNIETQMQS